MGPTCRPTKGRAATIAGAKDKKAPQAPEGMVYVPPGEYQMGAIGDLAKPQEFPRHPVKVNGFFMDTHEVTNAEFARFVKETGYKTVAERPVDWEELKKQLPPGTAKPPEENLKPGSMVFTPREGTTSLRDETQWWAYVHGADWRHPEGPKSNIDGKDNYPVVHIAYQDALAYAKWAGGRLPTEAEWEWAARGGLKDPVYPWGMDDVNDGPPRANFWQGVFPNENTKEDSYYLTAPVRNFKANGYGLYDMAGNVWEICSDKYDADYYKRLPKGQVIDNPKGPERSYNPRAPYADHNSIRGGSFLCNDSYCASYRVSARMPLEKDAATNHVGFRLVKDLG